MTRHRDREIAYKEKIEKAKNQRKARAERKKTGEILGLPHTLETLRIPDVTIPESKVDEELFNEEATDEVADIFSGVRTPKVLITVSEKAYPRTQAFCKQLAAVIPNAYYFPRRRTALKSLIPKAVEKEFTALIVVNENAKEPNGLVLSHLPHGPTAHFKVTNMRLKSEIKSARKSGDVEKVVPQLVVNRFQTRLGLRVGRLLVGLFPAKESRTVEAHHRCVTFHNQRDFIFFRHHRYQLKSGGSTGKSRLAMQDIGPRFTLKLRSLQAGVFDTKGGEYEWMHRRHEMETSRRKFFL